MNQLENLEIRDASVATDKPRMQGYVQKWIYNLFETYRGSRDLSQSDALEQASIAFFGLTHEEMEVLEEWAHQENRSPGQQALTILQDAIRNRQ